MHIREKIDFATPSSAKPEQAWQNEMCLQCRIEVQKSMPDKLLVEPDSLHGLIGTIFRFREGPIALTPNIKLIFLQVQVPE